jgi:putative ABC transport system permease protein
VTSFFRKLSWLAQRPRKEAELREELQLHLDEEAEERQAQGLAPEEARLAARRELGNLTLLKEDTRATWTWTWLEQFVQDLTYAARGFMRDRRFTFSALGAIFLAVGAATAVFSVVDRSLFRPLPYSQGDRLVSVGMIMPIFGPGEYMFNAAYLDWRVSQSAVDLTSWNGVAACDLGGDMPQRLNCARAEASFLPTLGVRPLLGQNFSDDEDQRGAEPVALLSWGMWRTNFGGDRSILGKKIFLDGAPTQIIGILPASFETPDLTPMDLFVPQKIPRGPNTRNYMMTVIGRLRPGQTATSAAAALEGPFEQFRADFAARVGARFAKTMWLHVEPLRDRQIRQYRLALWVLLGGVFAFVLIACANVANLLLARSAGRRQEFAIRAALGGSRLRLVAQLLTESALLGLAGGAAGCVLAWGLLRACIAIAPEGTLRMREATLDARVLAFATVLSLITALVFGLAPSLARLRVEMLDGDRATGHRRVWLRQALIASQLALSLVLLSGAGLLLMSLWRLQNTPLGLNQERVVTASFTLPAYRYGQDLRPTGWSVRQVNFFNELEARLNATPGAVASAITDSMPPGTAARTAPYASLANPEGKITPEMAGSVKWRYVSPGYFAALGIPIRRGRDFSDADRARGVHNVIVNELLARRLVEDEDPIGKHLGANIVIGVVGNVRNAGLDRPVDPEFYQVRKSTGDGIPGSGDNAWWRRATAVVRSNLRERHAEGSLRRAFRQVDPDVPIQIETMEAQVDHFLTKPQFQTTLLLLFAFTGLALAGIGLYGLISFLVAERTREIGVRVALGATPGAVTKLVVADGARWTAAGAILGIAASGSLLRLLQGLLYEVKVLDFRVCRRYRYSCRSGGLSRMAPGLSSIENGSYGRPAARLILAVVADRKG